MLPSCWTGDNRDVPNLGFPFNGNGLPAMDGISYVENAYQLLGRPGQFYLDKSSDYLYYIPSTGQNLATADVELPLQQSLLTLQGTPGHLAPVNQSAPGTSYSGSGWFLSTDRNDGDLDNEVEATGTNGDEVVAKCRELITPALGAAKSAKLIESVLAIENVKSVRDFRPLLQRS